MPYNPRAHTQILVMRILDFLYKVCTVPKQPVALALVMARQQHFITLVDTHLLRTLIADDPTLGES